MLDKITIHSDNFKKPAFEKINGIKFSAREIDVIACLLQGRPLKTIASLLTISLKTAENHSRNIMLKIGCNSRDGIINHIENSGTSKQFRQHYEWLSLEAQFTKSLAHIQSELKSKELNLTILLGNKTPPFFKETLKKHLEFLGFKLTFKKELLRDLSSQFSKHISSPQVILLPSEEILKLESTPLYKERRQQKSFIIVEIQEEVTHSEGNLETTYYLAFLKLLETLSPGIDVKSYRETLKKKFYSLDFSHTSPIYHKENIKRENEVLYSKVVYYYFISFIFLLLIGIIGYKLYDKKPELDEPIHSELTLPAKSVFLERPDLIKRIHKNLKEDQGIATIALVGGGGAGKTMLARSYANTYSHPVTWEINTETHASLITSFENLALALCTTEDEKKIIKNLREIKDIQEREKTLLSFIKRHLKERPNWLLIFDNVEDFSDLQEYFPHNSHTWGTGKIILTSRDENIQSHNSINHTIHIDELSPTEKEQLFSQIIEINFKGKQKEQVNSFLIYIPPFPLDISVTAYYLKATNISYDQYLENLTQHNQEFMILQKDILKNSNEYTKTRYDIISMSVQKLIETNKDFLDLLLLISLMDSQNIPRELLDNYKSKATTDEFIYHLKKYSLFLNTKIANTFSLHRSTQEIMFNYLKTSMKLGPNNQILETILSNFEKFMSEATEYENHEKMKMLISHAESLLKQASFFNELIVAKLRGTLGYLHYLLADFEHARTLLEKNFHFLSKHEEYQNSNILARTSTYLGIFHWGFGHFKESLTLLERSEKSYQKNHVHDYWGLARTLLYLGMIYFDIHQREKAKIFFEKALDIYDRYLPNHHIERAFTLSYLGTTYISTDLKRTKEYLDKSIDLLKKNSKEKHVKYAWVLSDLGIYYFIIGEYKKAVDLDEQVLKIYKAHYPENSTNVAWALRNLGSHYCYLGEFKKSKDMLEKSFLIFKNSMGENNVKTKYILYQLGIVHLKRKETKKAKKIFLDCYSYYKKENGHNNLHAVHALKNLGRSYIIEGDFQKAEYHLKKALELYKNNHSFYSEDVFEALYELYLQKSKLSKGKQKEIYKQKAINYLKQALEIIVSYFPENSPHFERIQKKIKEINT